MLQIATQTRNSPILRTKRLSEGRAYNLNPKSDLKPKIPLFFFVKFTSFLNGASKILTHPLIIFGLFERQFTCLSVFH